MSRPTLSVQVKKRTIEAERIVSLELVGVDNEVLPPFSAGSHVDVFLGSALVRQYSLWNAPSDRHRYCIAVKHEINSRGGSASIHNNICEGSRLTISEPRNVFPLVHAQRTILIAGGIGVTPILSMAEELSLRKADFQLHYCARSELHAAFNDYLSKAPFADRTHVYYSEAGDRLDVGELLAEPQPGTHVYVCGPRRLISAVQSHAESWPAGHIHYEHFDAPPADANDKPFELLLKRSGTRVCVNADETVADALARAGFAVNVSCQQGVCGTCLTAVLEGEPDHRDIILTEDEHLLNDQFTPCCSRSKSDLLVLDL